MPLNSLSGIISFVGIDALLISVPLIYLLYFKRKKWKKIPRELGFKKISAVLLAKQTIILLAGLFALLLAINLIFNFFNYNDLEKVTQTITALPLIAIAYLFIVRVTAEEVFFRGFLTNRMGILFSSILFALPHAFYGSAVEVIGAFVLGLWLARQFQKKQEYSTQHFGALRLQRNYFCHYHCLGGCLTILIK